MEKSIFTPKEIIQNNLNEGVGKVNQSLYRVILFGILAGAFIAIGGEASNVAIHDIHNYGLAKFVAGIVFPVGLMMIVVIGGQLFTGNCLLFMGFLDHRLSLRQVLINWITIFFSNFIGAALIAVLVYYSKQFNMSGGQLGAFTINLAVGKVNLSFGQALASGIMCNIIVCASILMAGATKDVAGKCIGVFFTILAFVVSGFEHCVANMYYLTAGMLASHNNTYVEKAQEVYGLSQGQIDALNIGSVFSKNLLPVTLGNIIGGAVIIGGIFYVLHHDKKEN